MTLTRLSGAKSLRDPLVSQLLGEWVASSPLAKARWAEATEVGYPTLIRNKQKEAVKQYASMLFPAPHLIGLLMELNVTKTGYRHLSAFMTRRGLDYTAATGHEFPCPIPTRQAFLDTWKELVKALELRPPVTVSDPHASGRSWPIHSWARYIQSRPPLVDTIDWTRPLTFILRGDAYLRRWELDSIVHWAPQPWQAGAHTRLFVGHWDCRVREQRNGRFGHYMGREPSGLWPFRGALIFVPLRLNFVRLILYF